MDDNYTLDRDSAIRLGKVVRKVERMGGKLHGNSGLQGPNTMRVALVKCTAGTPGYGYYPGIQYVENVPVQSAAPNAPPLSTPPSGSIPPGQISAPTGQYAIQALPNQYSARTQDCWIQSNPDLLPKPGAIYVGVSSSFEPNTLLPIFRVGAPASPCFVQVTKTTPQTIYIGRMVTDVVLNGTTTLTSASANFGDGDVGAVAIASGIPSQRTITDGGLTAGQSTFISPSEASFTSADQGALLAGGGLPANTAILTVTNSTTVQLSNPAPATLQNVAAAIGTYTTIQSVLSPTQATLSRAATVSASNVSVQIVSSVMWGYQAVLVSPLGVNPTEDPPYDGPAWETVATAWFVTPNALHAYLGSPDLAEATEYGAPIEASILGADASGILIAGDGAKLGVYLDVSSSFSPQPTTSFVAPGAPVIAYGLQPTWPGSGGPTPLLTLGQSYYLFGSIDPTTGLATGGDVWLVPGNTAGNVGVASQAFLADTGTDGNGAQFVNGIAIAIGGSAIIDGGSDY